MGRSDAGDFGFEINGIEDIRVDVVDARELHAGLARDTRDFPAVGYELVCDVIAGDASDTNDQGMLCHRGTPSGWWDFKKFH